jgi:hypothetical protein
MLDVHPLPHAAHGWRDFFIHIATIVIGLLIALGLEQSAEGIHHRHQVREARDAIAQERVANQHEFATTTELFRRETKRFQTNLAVLQYLQQQPGAAPNTWPGRISWHSYVTTFSTAAWQTAQNLGVTARMSPTDVRQLEHLYYQLGVVQASSAERIRAISAARRYMASDADPSRLTATQLANEIELAEALLIAHYRFGGDMRNLHSLYPDFAPSPETDELRAIVHEPPMTEEEQRELSGSNR